MKPLSLGSKPLDELLGGGFLRKTINTIYGNPGTGKTTMLYQTILEAYRADDNEQVFLVCETERGWSQRRFKKMAEARGLDFGKVWKKVILADVGSLGEQTKLITKKWPQMIRENGWKPELLAVDSFVNHYHGQLLNVPSKFLACKARELQGRLHVQLNSLMAMAEEHGSAVIIITWPSCQGLESLKKDWRQNLFARKSSFIGGRRLEFMSKLILHLGVVDRDKGTYAAFLEKHIERPTSRLSTFRITDRGIEGVKGPMTIEEYLNDRPST